MTGASQLEPDKNNNPQQHPQQQQQQLKNHNSNNHKEKPKGKDNQGNLITSTKDKGQRQRRKPKGHEDIVDGFSFVAFKKYQDLQVCVTLAEGRRQRRKKRKYRINKEQEEQGQEEEEEEEEEGEDKERDPQLLLRTQHNKVEKAVSTSSPLTPKNLSPKKQSPILHLPHPTTLPSSTTATMDQENGAAAVPNTSSSLSSSSSSPLPLLTPPKKKKQKKPKDNNSTKVKRMKDSSTITHNNNNNNNNFPSERESEGTNSGKRPTTTRTTPPTSSEEEVENGEGEGRRERRKKKKQRQEDGKEEEGRTEDVVNGCYGNSTPKAFFAPYAPNNAVPSNRGSTSMGGGEHKEKAHSFSSAGAGTKFQLFGSIARLLDSPTTTTGSSCASSTTSRPDHPSPTLPSTPPPPQQRERENVSNLSSLSSTRTSGPNTPAPVPSQSSSSTSSILPPTPQAVINNTHGGVHPSKATPLPSLSTPPWLMSGDSTGMTTTSPFSSPYGPTHPHHSPSMYGVESPTFSLLRPPINPLFGRPPPHLSPYPNPYQMTAVFPSPMAAPTASPVPKKRGRWNAIHVRIAWEIYNNNAKGKGSSGDRKLVPSNNGGGGGLSAGASGAGGNSGSNSCGNSGGGGGPSSSLSDLLRSGNVNPLQQPPMSLFPPPAPSFRSPTPTLDPFGFSNIGRYPPSYSFTDPWGRLTGGLHPPNNGNSFIPPHSRSSSSSSWDILKRPPSPSPPRHSSNGDHGSVEDKSRNPIAYPSLTSHLGSLPSSSPRLGMYVPSLVGPQPPPPSQNSMLDPSSPAHYRLSMMGGYGLPPPSSMSSHSGVPPYPPHHPR